MNSPNWKSLLFPKTLIRTHPITDSQEKMDSLDTEKITNMIFDSLPDYVAILDEQGNVKETNTAFRKFVDSRKKTATSAELNLTEILDEKHHEKFATTLSSTVFPVSLGNIL